MNKKRYDLENVEVWSKVCLPATGTIVVKSNYRDKRIFKNVHQRASNKLLWSYEPLRAWLRREHYIWTTDTFYDNLRIWTCLPIQNRHISGNENQVYKRNCKAAL